MADKHFNPQEDAGAEVWVGQYVVLFTDVLNQRDAIRRLERLPENAAEKTEYIRALKNSKGKVNGLRDFMQGFFKFYQEAPSIVSLDLLNSERRTVWEKWKGANRRFPFNHSPIPLWDLPR